MSKPHIYAAEVPEILSEFNDVIREITLETISVLEAYQVPTHEAGIMIQSQMTSHIAELFRVVPDASHQSVMDLIKGRLQKHYLKRIVNNEGCGDVNCEVCKGQSKHETDGAIH